MLPSLVGRRPNGLTPLVQGLEWARRLLGQQQHPLRPRRTATTSLFEQSAVILLSNAIRI